MTLCSAQAGFALATAVAIICAVAYRKASRIHRQLWNLLHCMSLFLAQNRRSGRASQTSQKVRF